MREAVNLQPEETRRVAAKDCGAVRLGQPRIARDQRADLLLAQREGIV